MGIEGVIWDDVVVVAVGVLVVIYVGARLFFRVKERYIKRMMDFTRTHSDGNGNGWAH